MERMKWLEVRNSEGVKVGNIVEGVSFETSIAKTGPIWTNYKDENGKLVGYVRNGTNLADVTYHAPERKKEKVWRSVKDDNGRVIASIRIGCESEVVSQLSI